MKPLHIRLTLFAFIGALFGIAVLGVRAENETDRTRDIKRKYAAFERQRPPRAKGAARPSKSASASEETTTSGATLGVTVWRMRPTGEISGDAPSVGGLTAERLSSGDRLAPGDRVRFTVEAPRDGRLYVVSREQYADGSYGKPYLLLPATRIRGGANRIGPGMLVGIPSIEDNPPFFTLERSRPDHVAEVVGILFVTKPLEGLSVPDEDFPLTREQFALVQVHESPIMRLDAVARHDSKYTKSEHEAEIGRVETRRLRQGDPLPQTLYQATNGGDSVLVTIPLPVGK